MKKHLSLGLVLVLFACFTKTQAQCSSGLSPEWKYQNAWYNGNSAAFSSGNEVWFSAIPNSLTVTVTDPAGVVHSDNHIISSISTSDAGQYIITNTATGCSETLDVTVDGYAGPGSGSVWINNGSDIHFDTGNVGIGTTTPDAFLEIEANGSIGGTWNPDNSFFTIKEDGATSSLIMDTNEIYGSGTLHIGSQFGDIVKFRKVTPTGSTDHMIIDTNGNMGIGTTTPGSWKLAVNGNIRAKEIKVETGWADYVFKEGYDLPTLKEVEKHIQEKGHLINIPSEAEVLENGIQLGEMNKLLLEKIEELTLYVIDQQKQIDELKKLLENE